MALKINNWVFLGLYYFAQPYGPPKFPRLGETLLGTLRIWRIPETADSGTGTPRFLSQPHATQGLNQHCRNLKGLKGGEGASWSWSWWWWWWSSWLGVGLVFLFRRIFSVWCGWFLMVLNIYIYINIYPSWNRFFKKFKEKQSDDTGYNGHRKREVIVLAIWRL